MKIKTISERRSGQAREALPALTDEESGRDTTKYCQTPPMLSCRNQTARRYSTDKKLTGIFLLSLRNAQTIATLIQTFYCDTLPPLLGSIHGLIVSSNGALKTAHDEID
ncbi:hypothetical protein [Burkholderia pseudomultivorans]|uniref:hypothetical protein n=1 Tax=Burkholderia pseudomultivorans TaxID=1207504 RepID=UPI001890197C|nr:hypothetical protein [Burkholderia pseudomultivorans]MBF5010333.1 hypothetical protein [Burkholderia pseudomultivorans]